MPVFEYKVVPAPDRGIKVRGLKTPEARFARALEELMCELGAEGWAYLRADTLPSVERSGLTGSTTNWRHVLVFQREVPGEPSEAAVADAVAAPFPLTEPPETGPVPAEIPGDPAPQEIPGYDPERPGGQRGATQMQRDNGVEDVSEVSGLTTSLETLAETRRKARDSDV